MMTTLAVDFGGRRIKLGLVSGGKVTAMRIIAAQAQESLASRLEVVAAELKNLCFLHGLKPENCAGIGFAYPSIIDTSQARILDHFGKFGDASTLDLRAWAKKTFRLSLAIDNDARMALIGEWCYGAGHDCKNLAIITLGTGIGTSAIIEDHVLRGVHGQAGILGGHTTLRYGGRPCVCGNIGCAEAEASTSRLEQLAKANSAFNTSHLAKEPLIDYAVLFKLASEGDACAQSLRDHSLEVWSALAVTLIHAYDPEVLILGGGVMRSADVILPAVQNYVRTHAHTPWGRVTIRVSKLGDEAALMACEWLVKEKGNYPR